MKIYIVIGCNDWEGGDVWKTRWFLDREQGQQYGEQLVKDNKCDFYEILEGEQGQQLD